MVTQTDIQLKVSQYEITDEKLPDSEIDHLPEWLRKELSKMRTKIKTNDEISACITQLENWIKEFPNSKVLSNFLCSAYKQSSSPKFGTFVRKNYKKFPDYLFARIEYADYCVRHNKLEKVKKIFPEGFDLKMIYPNREVFHVSEFLAFHSLLCRYFYMLGEQDTLQKVFQIMEDVAPNHSITLKVKELFIGDNVKSTVLDSVLRQTFQKNKTKFLA